MPEEDPRILDLRKRRATAALGGGEDRIVKLHAKGKLTARERIDLLLDSGTFQEIETFILPHSEDVEKYPGDGVVIGYGLVDGRSAYVYAQDFTVMGGSLGEMQSRKICQVMDLAVKSGSPVIGLIDSGGARIQEGVGSLLGYAEIFRRNAQYSGIIPQISLIFGPCAGGASYSPALTDMIIMVENQSYMFLTGPEVIRSVTGEVVDMETLGGAATHHATSGTAHLTVAKEQDALALCRQVLSYLPSNHLDTLPFVATSDDPLRMDEELNHIVPQDWGTAYTMHEVIERVVDSGSFLELFQGFAPNAVIGLARLDGMPIGILAQEPSIMAGSIDLDAADKMTRFVRFCDCYSLPLVTFVDSSGFLPGVTQEHRGIIRHGAKLLYAYSEATTPKVSVVTRKAYGGAYIVMNSKPLGADLAFAWPSAEIAVMGPEGAVNILYRKQMDAAADPVAERSRLVQEYRDKFLTPYAAAGTGIIDEVIEPKETRPRLIAALKALRDKSVTPLPRRHGNMPV
jgi:acetyl-CoA carboxylase carboxyltransferase component